MSSRPSRGLGRNQGLGFQADILNITLFSCYEPTYNNISDNVSPKFIRLNFSVRKNKYGIVPTSICLISGCIMLNIGLLVVNRNVMKEA